MPEHAKGQGAGSILSLRPGRERAREVVTRSGGIMRGKYPSRKAGRMVHYEGLLERDSFCLFEISPAVKSFREQPCTIRFPDGDRLRKYTPDVELTLVSGEIILVEIKPAKTARKPEMAHKLAKIEEFFRNGGHCFFVLDDTIIRQQPRLQNIRWIIQMATKARLSREQIEIGLTILKENQPETISAASALLKSIGSDPYIYILCGLVRLDINKPATVDSQIFLSTENDHDWFQLTNGFGF